MSGQQIGVGMSALAATALRSLPAAIGLFFLSFALLGALGYLLAPFPNRVWPLAAAFLYFHAVFIAAVTWKQMRPSEPALRCVASPGFAAGGLLVLPLLAFALLDVVGASYSCADGRAYRSSSVPNLPWVWIGWAVLTVSALPVRCIAAVVRETPPLVPIGRRLLLMVPFVPPVLFFGFPFQWHLPECSPPFEGWGFMEGGLVLVPLLGLFLFTLSFSMATLSAAFVDEDRLG